MKKLDILAWGIIGSFVLGVLWFIDFANAWKFVSIVGVGLGFVLSLAWAVSHLAGHD